MNYSKRYDVIVIGGGHAGTEAALAAARMGAQTLLLTHNIDTLGQMSCNPSIGGIGKGHLVKEVDAMGGAMGLAADQAGIQFRTLNQRKGPAVRATRSQIDRQLYRAAIRLKLENCENLELFQQPVVDLIERDDHVEGVVTEMGVQFFAKTVVLTVGTFLDGKLHIGEANFSGGRAGDPPSIDLAKRLRERPFRIDRLKTGMPARLDKRSLDYSKMEVQKGDDPQPVFSYMGNVEMHPEQVDCHITYTTEKTHDIIRKNLDRSPLFTGVIDGVGPRYCPSIEDKVVRFADKTSHQIFVEPEGLNLVEVYPNGISTSLPFDTQVELIHSIAGFEQAHIIRPGYAIEYDFFDPRDLRPTLETRFIIGLYFAGQINGTTGYEEAAAQGLMAGANAAARALDKEQLTFARSEAYMGVLVDDLITRGTLEPYRMFTSRAEYRLLLREDNADLRLTEKAWHVGLVGEAQWRQFNEYRDNLAVVEQSLKDVWVRPDSKGIENLTPILSKPISHEYNLRDLLKRPEVKIEHLTEFMPENYSAKVLEQAEIKTKYEGYLIRQQEEIDKAKHNEETSLPEGMDFSLVRGLSNEACQKLQEFKPLTIGQAGRISGITPATISLLLVHLKRTGS